MKKRTLSFSALWSIMMLGLLVACATAQPQNTVTVKEPLSEDASTDLQDFRERVANAHPGMEVIDVSGSAEAVLAPVAPPKNPRIAIFAKNQSTRRDLDDEIDPMRDLISAELAGQGMIVLDPKDIVESFNRFKVTIMEERMGLIDGLFTGGSVVRVAQMIGADYIALVSLLNTDVRSRNMSGQNINTYGARFSVKVFEASQGSTVFGKNVYETYPVNTEVSSTDDITYFHDLVDRGGRKIGEAIAASAPTWRDREPMDKTMVSFKVTTTIDALIDGLENGVRAPNELLDEMRRIVGGVTVELNGATIGSSPGTFKTTPGLHQLRINRQWMQPWQEVVMIQEGSEFNIGLELSTEGLAKFQSLEGFRAACAVAYAEAAWRKGIKVNYDTAAWRDVTQNIGNRGNEVNLEKKEINQDGVVNDAVQQDMDM